MKITITIEEPESLIRQSSENVLSMSPSDSGSAFSQSEKSRSFSNEA